MEYGRRIPCSGSAWAGREESAILFVGVDVAKRDHCLGAIDAQGQVVLKPVRFSQDSAGFAALAGHLLRLG
jgi:hypothetical protein